MVLGTEAPHFMLRRRTFVVVVAALATLAIIVAAMPSGATVQPARSTGSARGSDQGNGSLSDGASSTPITPTPIAGRTKGPTGPPSAEVRRLISLDQPIFCGGTQKPLVALTFDDGPGVLSPDAISQLRSHHEQTTFFLVGKLLQQGWLRPDLAKEVRFG